MRLSDIDIRRIGNTVQLIGGVWAGDGEVFFVPFPEDDGELEVRTDGSGRAIVHFRPVGAAIHLSSPVRVLNMDLEDWKRFLAQTDVMETEIMARAADGSLVKAVARKSQRHVDQNISWAVFRRDGYRCRYCARDDVPLTVDHLVLWEEGGPTIEENLVSACRKCNKTRGRLQYADWLRHPHYVRLARNRSATVEEMNATLVDTLDKIPRRHHVHSR